jgi:hypothetical protein
MSETERRETAPDGATPTEVVIRRDAAGRTTVEVPSDPAAGPLIQRRLVNDPDPKETA